MTLLRIDLPTFWFLYEGTPGGKLNPDKDFVIHADGQKTTLSQPWSQVVPWVCFGSTETPVEDLCPASITRIQSPARPTLTSPGRLGKDPERFVSRA